MKKFFLLIIIIAILPLQAKAYTAIDGDLLKSPDSTSVYLVKHGKRFIFPFQRVYEAYYGHDFSLVKTISTQEISQLINMGFVYYHTLLYENGLSLYQ